MGWATRPFSLAVQANRLIKQLGAKEWKEREVAMKSLLGLGPRVVPHLRKEWAATADPEVFSRLSRVLGVLDSGALLWQVPIGSRVMSRPSKNFIQDGSNY